MTPAAWSMLGFLLGVGATYAVARWVIGGLAFMGMRAAVKNDPKARQLASALASESCLAHAAILDDADFLEAAGYLVFASRQAGIDPISHFQLIPRRTKRLASRYRRYVKQGNLPYGHGETIMDCDDHGDSPWAGHVRCRICNRHCHLDDASPICGCGHRLLPEDDAHGNALPCSADRICRHCFKANDNALVKAPAPDPAEQATPLFKLPDMLPWGRCPSCDTELFLLRPDPDSVPKHPPPERCPICDHYEPQEHDDGASPC